MRYSSKLHVEIAGALATFYLVADVGAARPIIEACDELPADVEVLRLDLAGVPRLSKHELLVIDEVRTHWHATRRGVFRLSFELTSREATYEVQLGT